MTPDKCEFLIQMLGRCPVVGLWVDCRHPDADVPQRLWSEPAGLFDLGYRLPQPIPDLSIHPITGIVATLSFPWGSHRCVFPWAAVFGIQDKATASGFMWEGEIPEDARPRFRRLTPTEPQRPVRKLRPKLRLVEPPEPDGAA